MTNGLSSFERVCYHQKTSKSSPATSFEELLWNMTPLMTDLYPLINSWFWLLHHRELALCRTLQTYLDRRTSVNTCRCSCEAENKTQIMWNVRTTRTSNDPQKSVVEHLPPSLLRYDRRSFRSGRLTTGMFSVCQQHTNRSRTLWQFCGPVCFTFVLHLLQPVAHRMDVGDAHCWARTGSSPTCNTLLAGPLYQFWGS